MILTKPLPHLAILLGGYFHLDWYLEYGSEKEAIAAFVGDATDEELKGTIVELSWLLDQNFSESYLQNVINDDLDCPYWAAGHASEYLKNIFALLKETSGKNDEQVIDPPPKRPESGSEGPPVSGASSLGPKLQSMITAPTTNQSRRSFDFKFATREFLLRPFQLGLLCWFTLGATSCFKISWVRLKDFNYANPFFTESAQNDGWFTGLIIGVIAGSLWAIAKIWKKDSWHRIIGLATSVALIAALIKLPISGRWGNVQYELAEKGFQALQNAKATSLRFYKTKSYDKDTPPGQRTYAGRFKQAKQRTYIRWELKMQYQPPGAAIPFTVDVLLRRYDGRDWSQVGWSHPQLNADASSTQLEFTGGWGLLERGTFQADFWIAGKGLASANFEIY